jgi:hypothetical protein
MSHKNKMENMIRRILKEELKKDKDIEFNKDLNNLGLAIKHFGESLKKAGFNVTDRRK